ncbi:MAG: hypothetical protein AVDCRST_MAG18-2171 [uncultured Thermomicrobiales bacterium]|uniref:Uncharacterized protein n=1 Tax=uncultured Thermomicrobiales bacterium TaxID=1645740 RepID=A0A6J4VA47_9BACT|nr:MAG: hypothetical protein AVDCRST_MAG18-2171 [uncultured Thermomicrobiales bacterium]
MSTNEDRQKMDFADTASATSARSTEVPTEIEDSPTVRGGDGDLSQNLTARADIPAPERGAEATMTASPPGIDPGAPFNPGMGEIVGDVAGDGRLKQAGTGDTIPGAMEGAMADHGGSMTGHEGTNAGLDETSGSDDPSAQMGRDNPRRASR